MLLTLIAFPIVFALIFLLLVVVVLFVFIFVFNFLVVVLFLFFVVVLFFFVVVLLVALGLGLGPAQVLARRLQRDPAHPMTSRQDLPPRHQRASSDLAAIAAEFAERGVGPLMLAEAQRACHQLAPRYNAAIYSEIGNWRHGLDDLVQDVVSESLLAEHQAEYMIKTASSIDDFRRLLIRQVKRRLARRRVRTVVDNLLDRARPILDEPTFRTSTRHQYATYAPHGQLREDRAATFLELRAASNAIKSIPQVGPTKRDRAPIVYTTPDLRLALTLIAEALPCAFRIRELDQVFRLTLPHMLPGVLDLDRHFMDGDPPLGASAAGQQASMRAIELLDDDRLLVLGCKLAGESDAEVAARLGTSRRTAGNRKHATYAVLEEVLGPLTVEARLACLDDLRSSAQAALSASMALVGSPREAKT